MSQKQVNCKVNVLAQTQPVPTPRHGPAAQGLATLSAMLMAVGWDCPGCQALPPTGGETPASSAAGSESAAPLPSDPAG